MSENWQEIEQVLQELIVQQEKGLLKCAQRIVPGLIQDDLLQPNDFPALENHPEFRYEEGVLHGFQLVSTALKRQFLDSSRKLK